MPPTNNECSKTNKAHWIAGMDSSTVESQIPSATSAQVNNETLSVELSNGRTTSVPVAWYPRLSHSTPQERSRWRLIGKGRGIHWPELDEDISVENLLAGKPSTESQSSFKHWLINERITRLQIDRAYVAESDLKPVSATFCFTRKQNVPFITFPLLPCPPYYLRNRSLYNPRCHAPYGTEAQNSCSANQIART